MNNTRDVCGVVALEVPKWFYNSRGSDWRMKIELARELDGYRFRLQTGRIYTFLYSLQYALGHHFPRPLRKKFELFITKLRSFFLRLGGASILVTQGDNTPLPKNVAIIWETYFLPPQEGENRPMDGFYRGGGDRWIRAVEKYAPYVAKIAVRGSYSVSLLRKMYPEYKEKVVNLGFVQKEFNMVTDEYVKAKQNTSFVEILFVGREARRKGLDVLISALEILRNKGVCNFSFTIVSSFVDGPVDVPSAEWVHLYNSMTHEEVLKIFKRAQIFAMPSKFESYGLVYLESLAYGCVTVSRDAEPQKEMLDYGNAGVLVNHFSASDIAAKLEPILRDPDLRVALALSGLRHYKRAFSQEKIRQDWTSVLRSLQ